MGRGKIEIKRIENSSNRQVTYSKRRSGIIKKAGEITVLCEAQVSLIIINSSGKLHEFCSPSTTLVNILERYHKHAGGKKLWDAKHENLYNEIERIKKENDGMQIQLRHLKGEDITSLNHKELISIEDALSNGLTKIRDKKEEIYEKKKKRIKEEENINEHLRITLHEQEMAKQHQAIVKQQQELAMENNARQIENGYHRVHHHDYHAHMTFAFRVQPIQPNLQERI